MLGDLALDAMGEDAIGDVVDFHDDPIAQNATLQIPPDPAWLEQMQARKRRNLTTFRRLVVPSLLLAEIAGLDLDRVVVAGNGTDVDLIRPTEFPSTPAVGFMSGAAAGRGIESLILAVRSARTTVPDLRLILWLVATGEASQAYLTELQRSTAADSWIEYASAPYTELGPQLGRVTVQCVPNPPAPYWDAVSPIKLFDAMASGRPVVVSPRLTMRADVERDRAGLVAAGDRPEDLAEAIVKLVVDEELARSLGANARAAAEQRHDWRIISRELAARLVASA
jgi:hypothetical protein